MSSKNIRPKKVLIVDDSLTIRMYHKHILSSVGIECDEAENGMEALEKVQKTPYALCLVDINMPVLDGYSFVRRFRAGEGHPAPVIMVSTESEDKDKTLSYQCGANMHLTKPVKTEVLLAYLKLLT